MASLEYVIDAPPVEVPETTPLQLYERHPMFDPGDIRALIRDFFLWFENEWKQPVKRDDTQASELLEQVASLRVTIDEQQIYTRLDLSTLTGLSLEKVSADLTEQNIHPVGRSRRRGNSGTGPGLYRGRDLVPAAEKWERDGLHVLIDGLWARFVREPCGRCEGCLRSPGTASFHCRENNSHSILMYRRSFSYLLRALQTHRNIESWWTHEREAIFACKRGAITEPSKLVLLYLLDRHLLDLPFDDMHRLSFRGIDYIDLLRPYRNRRPGEYAQLLRAMEIAQYGEQMRYDILSITAVMVLLKYGFPGIAELGRRLSSEEVQQVVRERRLLTPHLGYGIYLGVPLSDDLCVGHVVLDEIRENFWKFAAAFAQEANRPYWDRGPRCWSTAHIHGLERVLTATVWENGQALLVPRQETQLTPINPYRFRHRTEGGGGPLNGLPPMFREALKIYVDYRYQQLRMELSTISSDLKAIITFFSWVKGYTDPGLYTSWDRDTMRAIVHAFRAAKRSSLENSTLCNYLIKLHVFFETLAEIRLPHPPGYTVIPSLLPAYSRDSREIPPEEVLDRLFHDGVCRLDYDPYSRLALTIQYFCGTRVTETCDLPVFCIVEAEGGKFAYLVIPRGKTKQERSFPIVQTGMDTLLAYMKQVVSMQEDKTTGTLRNFSRPNIRYLETDGEKAYYWDYLFDRQHYSAGRACKRQRVLGPSRVNYALGEAMLLAAKKNPSGFFQQDTYSPSCGLQRQPGEKCGYLALQDGVTVCPVCGGSLPGQRGHRCKRRVIQEVKCGGIARDGSYFCPQCDTPLAELVSITSHTFRHNSVTRAHRHGVPLAENMLLHGHQTIPMHLKYVHLLPEDQQEAVNRIFAEKLLRELRQSSGYAPGQMIEGGVAKTVTVTELIGIALGRELNWGTAGLWGGFWTGVLAEEGASPPTRLRAEFIITKDTYAHAVAQYRYQALTLAISEVALERGTRGRFKAEIASFLEPREIERVVSSYMEYVQRGYVNTAIGVRLIEANIKAKRLFLQELAEMLRPWWERLGSIDRLVGALYLGEDAFQKPGASVVFS